MRRALPLAAVAGFAVAVVPALAADQTIQATSDDTFNPADVTLNVGETVTIANSNAGSHNVRWEDESAARMPVGKMWETKRTFSAAGTYRFYCEPHGGPGGDGMSGVVRVSAQSTTTGQTTGPAPSPGVTPTAPASGDSTAPRLTRVRARATRRLLVLRLTLSEAASVRVEVRSGDRTIRRRFRGRAGSQAFRVRSALRAGRLTIRLSARDSAGNSSPRRTLRLRVR